MSTAQRAWLIDASIYIFRAWFAMPDRWATLEGQPLNAVYGYTAFLLDFLQQTPQHRYCGAAFDESLGSCFRNDIYVDYKSSRELPDDALAFQLQACRRVTELLGIPCYSGPRYEADDYLATLGALFGGRDIAVTVITRDKDLGQIMRTPEDRWWDFAANIQLDPLAFEEKFGVTPAQFGDYLALVGDKVDDIPGVPGVGAKTAARLLQTFGDLQAIGDNFEEIGRLKIRGASGVQNRVQEHWPQVLLARQLTGLETAIPDVDELPEFSLRVENITALIHYLQTLNLSGPLLRRCEKLARETE